MKFRLPGSVAVITEHGDVPPGAGQPLRPAGRAAPSAQHRLSVDQLTAALKEDEPPTRFRTVLQGHVARLCALPAEHGAREYGIALATHATAYELRIPESLVDTHRFEEPVALSRDQRQPADAVRMLRNALACRQGPAPTGGVEDLRLASVEALAEAHGRPGEHAKAAAVLRSPPHPVRAGTGPRTAAQPVGGRWPGNGWGAVRSSREM